MVPGRPIQVAAPRADGTLDFRHEEVARILNNNNIRNLPIAVVSVAGACRTGKSFLENFFILFLEAMSGGRQNEAWFDEGIDLNKFHWRGGVDPDTEGIFIWSNPFILQKQDGSEIAVLIMDTQGTFDFNTSMQQCANIFAFSSIMASHQIYNVQNQVHEYDLQHLALFTEMVKIAAKDQSQSILQKITFLIRDWCNDPQYPYGFQGGKKYLEDFVLKTNPGQPAEMQQLRKNLKKSVSSLDCFLMPYPGQKIANNKMDTTLGEIDPDFGTQVTKFVESIFAQSLSPKMMNGRAVTCGEYAKIFEIYGNVFNSNKLPVVRSIVEATAESNYTIAYTSALALYIENMRKLVFAKPPFCNQSLFESTHQEAEKMANKILAKVQKLGCTRYDQDFSNRLRSSILKEYQNLKSIVKSNEKERKEKEERQKREDQLNKRIDSLQEEIRSLRTQPQTIIIERPALRPSSPSPPPRYEPRSCDPIGDRWPFPKIGWPFPEKKWPW